MPFTTIHVHYMHTLYTVQQAHLIFYLHQAGTFSPNTPFPIEPVTHRFIVEFLQGVTIDLREYMKELQARGYVFEKVIGIYSKKQDTSA
jgi:hypothetical protein